MRALLRSILALGIAALGVSASLWILDYALTTTGVTALLGIRQHGFLFAGVVIALLGALVTCFLGGDIAEWSVNVQPLPAINSTGVDLAAIVARLSANYGWTSVPRVGVYAGDDINAFALGRSQSKVLLVVSQGLVERATAAQAEVILAHNLTRVASGYVYTQMLLQGAVAVFTLFPARIWALCLGTALRTSEEDTPTDSSEHLLIAGLELLLVPLAALFSRWFARYVEIRVDSLIVNQLGRDKVIQALQLCADEHAKMLNREVFTTPYKFGLAVERRIPWLSYHRSYSARIAALR